MLLAEVQKKKISQEEDEEIDELKDIEKKIHSLINMLKKGLKD